MGQTLSSQPFSDPVGSLDSLRPTPAKADLHRSDVVGSSDPTGPIFGEIVKDALIRHYGSVKAAAISLDVDPSLMQREFEAGKFARLERADCLAKARIAEALTQAYAPLSTPEARALHLFNQFRDLLRELEQLFRA